MKMSDEAKKILSDVEKYGAIKKSLEAEWNLNMAYYMGKQWVSYTLSTGNIEDRGAMYRNLLTRNIITPTVDSVVGNIIATKMRVSVTPNSETSDDIYAAKIAEAIAEMEVWEQCGLAMKTLYALPVAANCGTYIYHPYFNPQAGKYYDPEWVNEKYMAGWEEGRHDGRLGIETLTPFDVIVCNDAESEEQIEEVIISKGRAVESLYRDYDKKVKPQNPKTLKFSEMMEQYMSTLGQSKNRSKFMTNMVMTRTKWCKPNKKYKKGRVIMVTDEGEEVFKMDALPWGLWEEKQLPFYFARYKGVKGKLWGIPPTSEARPLQKEINIVANQWKKYKKHHMFLPLLNPSGNGITEEQFSNTAGEMINYIPNYAFEHGGAPHYPALPQFNSQILNDMERYREDIWDVYGLHASSQGKESRLRSGRAISMMQSADEARQVPLQMNIESALTNTVKCALRIIANTYTIPRQVNIVGDVNARYVKNFTGKMLRNNFNATVQLKAALPLNKQQARDTVNQWWSMGIIPQTQEGLQTAWKMLELESFKPAFAAPKAEEQARYENSKLDEGYLGGQVEETMQNPETGEVLPTGRMKWSGLPINDWDDDYAHLKVHEDRQMEIDYLRLIEETPEVAEAYNVHKLMHRERIQIKEQLAIEAQMKQQALMAANAPQGEGGNGEQPNNNAGTEVPAPAANV